MTQLGGMTKPAGSAQSNVYTVLALAATLALLAGVIYVGYKNAQLTGDGKSLGNPFGIVSPQTSTGR